MPSVRLALLADGRDLVLRDREHAEALRNLHGHHHHRAQRQHDERGQGAGGELRRQGHGEAAGQVRGYADEVQRPGAVVHDELSGNAEGTAGHVAVARHDRHTAGEQGGLRAQGHQPLAREEDRGADAEAREVGELVEGRPELRLHAQHARHLPVQDVRHEAADRGEEADLRRDAWDGGGGHEEEATSHGDARDGIGQVSDDEGPDHHLLALGVALDVRDLFLRHWPADGCGGERGSGPGAVKARHCRP
mmetsp:Transcript_18806/g.53128  ORF Transcript_18806/g.53128 Transcript_18806/m.53128 type:complete len:249 (+) Transcript_18806:133-879(+)